MEEARSRRQAKLGRLLRAIRRERGVTQVQLAEHLGLPQSVISKNENGERQVVFLELEEICDAVGIRFGTFYRRWASTPDDFEDE